MHEIQLPDNPSVDELWLILIDQLRNALELFLKHYSQEDLQTALLAEKKRLDWLASSISRRIANNKLAAKAALVESEAA